MGKVFGAYSDIPWSSKKGYKNGNCNTFIFSLRDDNNFVKLKCLDNTWEVFHCSQNLTMIGRAFCGFWIYDDCNTRGGVSTLGRYG